MKQTIILILCIFFILSLKAQDLNKIKNQNVYFIFFEKGELMKKYDISRNENDTIYGYHFYEKLKKEFKFSFNYSKYPTFDDAHNKINERMLFRLNQTFLKKNKDIIITREFMEKVGEDVIKGLLADGFDHVFLIDKGEIKNKKILLREVRFIFSAEM